MLSGSDQTDEPPLGKKVLGKREQGPRALAGFLIVSVLAGAIPRGQAALIGPWFRYQCDELGFQMPVASGWRVSSVPGGIVFAMQSNPEPYVRVAIGRLALDAEALRHLTE